MSAALQTALLKRPRPWRIVGDSVVEDANGQEVCTVDTQRNLDDDVAQALAQLIAASEAPAEGAGELDRAIRRMRNQLVGSATFMQLMFGREDVRKVLDALEDLRARSSAPEAREGEAVAWGRFGPDGSLIDLSRLSWGNYEGLYRHPAAPSADKLRIAVEALEKAKNQWDPPLTAPDTTCEAGGAMDPVTGWLSNMMVRGFGIRSSGGRLKRMVNVIVAAEVLATMEAERAK